MTCELTKNDLCSCFDLDTVAKLLQLPLVKRYLSAEDYIQCQGLLIGLGSAGSSDSSKKMLGAHAILPLSLLERSDNFEVASYLSIVAVKDAYFQMYGAAFQIFLSQRLIDTEQFGFSSASLYSWTLGPIQEKKLMQQLQMAMALPLEMLTHAILEQDFYLQEIASVITYQSSQAHRLISTFEADDLAYKNIIINLGLSVIKLGLGVVNGAELVNVIHALSTLASGRDGVPEARSLGAVVKNIESLLVMTHWQVLQEAEKQLLSTAVTEDLVVRWVMYRAHIFRQSHAGIHRVIETCLKQDDFLKCVIQETMKEHPDCVDDSLSTFAIEKMGAYLNDITHGFQLQVNKIAHIRDAIVSDEGREKIRVYFEKMGLINYTLEHEGLDSQGHRFLTKKLGHRLSFYFPDVVFQKKWAPLPLFAFFNRNLVYSKQKITVQEYKARRESAVVVLGLFRNSSHVKQSLFMTLEEQIPYLNDSLIEGLQQQSIEESGAGLQKNTLPDEPGPRIRRYTLTQSHYSLFGVNGRSADSPLAKRRKSNDSGVVLLSRRSVAP